MRTAKIAFIWSIIVVFLAVSTVGILGAIGKLSMSGWEAAIILVGPCLGIVASALSARHLFDDPDAVRVLREEHHKEILRMKREHADITDQDCRSHKTVESALSTEISRLEKHVVDLAKTHEAEIKKMQAEHYRFVQQRKVTQVMPSIVASGSARTEEKKP